MSDTPISTALRVNADRLWQTHMDIARIGPTPGGGSGRLALTKLDAEARNLFVSWCRDAGLTVRVDRIGSIFARRAGTDAQAPPVMTGSHLDTQPLGGRFDGIYGVLAGLEVARTLNEQGVRTRTPIDVVVWTDEEGVRFSAGGMASSVFAGSERLEDALAKRDADGISKGEALERIGYAGTEPVGGFPVNAFFEAHIEQGPILEKKGRQVGVVIGAQGSRYFLVTVDGEEGHAGTLPMALRRDAVVASARMIDAINRIAYAHEPHPVITTGRVVVRPNSRNTVPGQVTFTIDSRHPDDALLAEVEAEMRDACERIAAENRVGVRFDRESVRGTVRFDDECVKLVRDAAERLGVSHLDIWSGAGHDACNLAQVAPTAMVFVPCEDGISHNEREYAKLEDLAAGADVLMHAMLGRAGVV